MKTEQILKLLYAIRKEEEENRVPMNFSLEEAIEKAENELALETAKEDGKGEAFKLVRKYLNVAAVGCPSCGYSYTLKSGEQFIFTPYIFYTLKEHLPIPERSKEDCFGWDFATKWEKNIWHEDIEAKEQLALPTVAELRKEITKQKAERAASKNKRAPILYKLNGIFVNAEYLLSILLLLKGARHTRTERDNRERCFRSILSQRAAGHCFAP